MLILKINLKNILFWYIFNNILTTNHYHNTKNMFGSVVAVAFQITFCAEMHVNDIFLFFKNYFWHQHIKTIKKIQTASILTKQKKNLKFNQT